MQPVPDPGPNGSPSALALDDAIRRALRFVGASGAGLSVLGAMIWGVRGALSVGVGSVVAVLNLIVLAWVGRALVDNRSRGWLVIALLKMGALFGGVGWLFHRDVVGALPFVVGYASLMVGIFLAQITTPPPPDETSR